MSDAAENIDVKTLFILEIGAKDAELGMIQYDVINLVAAGKYDEAKAAIDRYHDMKSNYKAYKRATEKIYTGSKDLIDIIKNKMETPGLRNLLPQKQEELNDDIQDNWQLLKSLMKRLRTVERELATNDSKSTLIVIKAMLFSATFILVVFLINEIFSSLGQSFPMFVKEVVNDLTKFF